MGENHVFLISNTPHDVVFIEGNKINNWNKVWFFMPYSNDHTYPNTINYLKKLKCVNNIAYNDDGVWCISTPDKYYGFIVYEGIYAEYKNNTVEGIKIDFRTDGTNKVAMYDAYLSATTVVYENNVNRNNISVIADLIEQCPNFFKSKNVPIGYGKRYCRNNIFVIDKEWVVNLLGSDLSPYTLTNKLYEFESPIDEFVFEGNYIKCVNVKLSQQNYQACVIKNFLFKNNIIEADTIDGHVYQVVVDDVVENITIDNNTLKELKQPKSNYKKLGFLQVGKKNNPDVKYIKDVSITNNTIIGYYLECVIRGQDIYRPDTIIFNNMKYANNTIKSLSNTVASDRGQILMFDNAKGELGFTINKLDSYNNVYHFENANNIPTYYMRIPVKEINNSYELTCKPNRSISLIAFTGDLNCDREYTVNLKITLSNKNNLFEELNTSFKYSYSSVDGRNKIF